MTEATPILSETDAERLRLLIEKMTGIAVAQNKAYLIESRLKPILADLELRSFGELHDLIASTTDEKLHDRLVDAITTNETLWFRDDGPWEILRKELIPKYIDQLSSGAKSRIRIWSAACSTGQEPYSLALLICWSTMLLVFWQFDLPLGTDSSYVYPPAG